MRLVEARIDNFRGIKGIEFKTDKKITVIVGPNGTGKTTIFEAIRITKSLLAPAYQNEELQVLLSLGAFNQQLQQLVLDGIAGDPKVKTEIRLRVQLSDGELAKLDQNIPRLAHSRIQNSFGSAVQSDLALIQFLSSPDGRTILDQATSEIKKSMAAIQSEKALTLHLIASQEGVRGNDQFAQEAFTLLARMLPPALALINYFPADRAMPTGEVAIQIGSGDMAAQLQSHLGAPASKYQRLKQHLVNRFLMGEEKQLKTDFQTIFDQLLPGKALQSLRLNSMGGLAVLIREAATGAVYDIDHMSSGEKGLILTFLFMKRSTAPGGLIMIDEPELHLNPAVCRNIVPFLIEHVIPDADVQILLATHSPEIVSSAHEREDCALLHLRSRSVITPVYSRDREEAFEIIRRLGSRSTDVFFTKGALYVEGEHDVDLLESGFPNRVMGYKLTHLRGRGGLEKEIKLLQQAETSGQIDTPHCFILDNDRRPASYTNSKLVRVAQWERYCFENYLLEEDPLYDVLKEEGFIEPKEVSRTDLRQLLVSKAMGQIVEVAVKEVYAGFEPENPGLRSKEIATTTDPVAIAQLLAARLEKLKQQLGSFDRDGWVARFSTDVAARVSVLQKEWESGWRHQCDGKRVLMALYEAYKIKIGPLALKTKIIRRLREEKKEPWAVVDSVLDNLLK